MTTAEATQLDGSGVITNSSLSTFGACRRKYYYSYRIGWRPKSQAMALRFGSAIHRGLDMLAKGMAMADIMDAIDSGYQILIVDVAGHDDWQHDLAIENVTVQELVRGYATAWANSQVKILDSESRFELPIINPATGHEIRIFRVAGAMDRLCELPDGRLALMETKTSSEDVTPGSDYRQVLALNQQISLYMLAARTRGVDVATCLYDLIRKPGIRPTDQPILDANGFEQVFQNTEDGRAVRLSNKDGTPKRRAETSKGQYMLKRPMTPDEWREKLRGDIAADPARYYQRMEVPRLESDLDEFRYELYEQAQDLHACVKSGRWYRRTASCRNYGRLCEFYGICSGQIDTSQGVPDGFRLAETCHEELANET